MRQLQTNTIFRNKSYAQKGEKSGKKLKERTFRD